MSINKLIVLVFILTFSYVCYAETQADIVNSICRHVDCRKLNDFILELKQAVDSGDKEKVADFMAFPLRVNKTVHGKNLVYMINNKKEFIKKYHWIMTKEVISSASTGSINNTIYNYQGLAINSGIFWLNGLYPFKIIIINSLS